MNKEWNSVGKEHAYGCEIQQTPAEYSKPESEYSSLPPEYTKLPQEWGTVTATSPEKEKNRKERKSLSRKMVYMVAATVSVVVLSQSIDATPWENDFVTEETPQDRNDSGFEWFKVPGWTGTGADSEKNDQGNAAAKVVSTEITYDIYGYANGYVIPVKKGELWGLIDYDGKVILEPSYSTYWTMPNDDGYAIFADEEGYYIVGRDGVVHEYPKEAYQLAIGDENIVSYVRYSGETENYIYERLDGTVLYNIENVSEPYNSGTSFHDGKAFVHERYTPEREGMNKIVELFTDGRDANVVYYEDGFGSLISPMDSYADGYVVSYGDSGGVTLANTDTWELVQTIRLLGAPAEFFVNKGLPEDNERTYIEYWDLKSYLDNGSRMLHYKNYGCMEVTLDEGKTQDVLFDFGAVGENEELISALAIYDTIYFDNFKYLAVKDGDEKFYIDFSGNIVSGPYYEATSFTEEGYALIMKEEGTAYIVNDRFEVVEEISGVISATGIGELFLVEHAEDDIDVYYYGSAYAEGH